MTRNLLTSLRCDWSIPQAAIFPSPVWPPSTPGLSSPLPRPLEPHSLTPRLSILRLHVFYGVFDAAALFSYMRWSGADPGYCAGKRQRLPFRKKTGREIILNNPLPDLLSPTLFIFCTVSNTAAPFSYGTRWSGGGSRILSREGGSSITTK